MSRAGAALLRIAISPAVLSSDNGRRRVPHGPGRSRPAPFHDAFDGLTLHYDCFWDADGADILLVGPPGLNLQPDLSRAQYTALPSGVRLGARQFVSRSTMVTRLSDAPPGTEAVRLNVMDEEFVMPVQANLSARLAGARMLFAISRNNRLDWIARWAEWHVRLHGVDTVILFDNGSTAYDKQAIEQRLGAIAGLRTVGVVSFPYRFGARDGAALTHPYWAHFLQIAMFSLVLRRFGRHAAGLLNTDIDELAFSGGASIFDLARATPVGSGRLLGRWIEAIPRPGASGCDHVDFPFCHRNPLRRITAPKWALDPCRVWLENLDVHPYWHRIYGAPRQANRFLPGAVLFHFKAINTNWKEDRSGVAFDPRRHAPDPILQRAFDRFRTP